MAYGLVESLTGLIKATSDISAKEACRISPQELDEKEKTPTKVAFAGELFGMPKKFLITLVI